MNLLFSGSSTDPIVMYWELFLITLTENPNCFCVTALNDNAALLYDNVALNAWFNNGSASVVQNIPCSPFKLKAPELSLWPAGNPVNPL